MISMDNFQFHIGEKTLVKLRLSADATPGQILNGLNELALKEGKIEPHTYKDATTASVQARYIDYNAGFDRAPGSPAQILTAQQREIVALREAVTAQEKTITGLRGELSLRGSEIEALRGQAALQSKTIEAQAGKVADQNMTIEAQAKAIAVQAGNLEIRRTELDGLFAKQVHYSKLKTAACRLMDEVSPTSFPSMPKGLRAAFVGLGAAL